MVFFKAEEVDRYENDISAKKETQEKSSRFQKKNEYSKWKKSIGCKRSEERRVGKECRL